MPHRTLIVTPVAVVVGLLLVGAVIESGQQARSAKRPTPSVALADPSLLSEAARIDRALAAPQRCLGALECDLASSASRTREAARQVRSWPHDRRFGGLRDRVIAQLEAEADLLDARAARALDASHTWTETQRLDTLRDRRDAAYRATLQAQHSVGLLSDDEYAAARAAARAR